MKNVKNYIEIILLVVLMTCVYNGQCQLLGDLVNTSLGKLSMIAFVVAILNFFGKTAGVLAGCIFVFGLHIHRREGFKEGAGLEIKIGNDAKDKEETKKVKAQAKKDEKIATKSKDDDDDDDDDDDKEGFSIQIGGTSPPKEGYWERKNKEPDEEEGFVETMKEQIKSLQKKVKKLEKKKKEGFANLRQNRRLKINNISVLNTTDLDRTIKKDSEVRTLNSSS
jgi:hypothetical protein